MIVSDLPSQQNGTAPESALSQLRRVREELFRKMQVIPYDDSEWTPSEMAALSGTAFADLDDTDYSEYLDKP